MGVDSIARLQGSLATSYGCASMWNALCVNRINLVPRGWGGEGRGRGGDGVGAMMR
jgi:hypothetical protein